MRCRAQETKLVNIKHSPFDQLIDRTTIFGNPFSQYQYGREECIRKFESYFWERIERDPEWRAEVQKLKGKVLGCHCVPLSCHGRVYMGYLETYEQIEKIKKECSG